MIHEIMDKVLLLICCAVLYLFLYDFSYAIIPVIIVIIMSSLFVYYENLKIKLAGNLIFSVLCIFVPPYLIFLPLLLYDIFQCRVQFLSLLLPALLIVHNLDNSKSILTFLLLTMAVSYLLKYKTDKLKLLTAEYNDLRDSSSEVSLLLEEKNHSILKNQDYEINLATLNERNRISREIHDNIGHLLSRSLLQVGALLTITRDDMMKEELSSLKNSLSGGMDQIRNSIHQMYDESIDLYSQLEGLVKDFTFCEIKLDYDINTLPSLSIKQSMIAITKESLANIIRHSNATRVNLCLREHPVMYQLILQDNGTMEEQKKIYLQKALQMQVFGESMGLRNISDRVKSLDGILNISMDQGFKIFISIPKKKRDDE